MCGIAGFIVKKGTPGADRALADLVLSIEHRGPDGRGSLIQENGEWIVGLAHTRLAILDLSDAGRQPMAGSRPGDWIVYNGEVYNFQELRSELEAEGCRFDSRTDTEVILKGIEAKGTDFVHRLRGMFAFACLEQDRRKLVLTRDPLGIKPLYYYRTPDCLVFASEVRSLLATGWVPRRIGRRGLQSFLEYGSVQAPATILEDVYSLLPGEVLEAGFAGNQLVYRDTKQRTFFAPPAEQPHADRAECASEVRRVLDESVRMHLISDVPVGVFLSGGIDSSAIVGLASRHSTRVKTFAVIFEEQEFNERTHAKCIADLYSTDHHEIALSEHGLLDLLPKAIASMDQPTADGVNTYVISQAVRNAGIKVALSGLGGDELFAGYGSFRRAMKTRSLHYIPAPIRKAAAAAGKTFLNGSVARSKFWRLVENGGDAYQACRSSRQMFGEDEIGELTGSRYEPDPSVPEVQPDDPINQVSRCELQGYMVNTLLRDSDFMSMASGLEVRVPFVDVEVVRSVVGLPGSFKLDPQRPKGLLLDAMQSDLPPQIWQRPKMGFTLPFRRWMISALRGEIDQALASSGPLAKLGIRTAPAQRVWTDFKKSQESERWPRSWTLYILGKWCEQNGVTL